MPGSRRPPLEGIRVADFTWVWAGPFCTLQLAHLGAEVIRVESQGRICVTRLLPPWADGEPGVNRSGYFNQYNQGKRSILLDLKKRAALQVARDLVAKSDVVCENFAVGVMERLGLGYEDLRRIKPDLIMISLSGYGASGPQKDFVSYGPAQVPLSGMSSLTGYRGWPPMHVGISYGDPTAGLHAAVAVLAALIHRERTGEGQYIDLSQQESLIALLAEGLMAYEMNGEQPPRDGNRDPHMAPHGVFRCAGEDRWVAIAVRSDAEWKALAAAMGRPELGDDERYATAAGRKAREDEVEKLVADWTISQTPESITETLQAAGIPAFPAMTNRDLAGDAHLQEREFFTYLPHPEVGVRQHIGIPWKFSGSPLAVTRAAPTLGQDTDAVLREVLGYPAEKIEDLRRQGALF